MAKIKKRGRMPVHISASQIKLAMMCYRAWFFQKVLGLLSIELEAHRVGGDTHEFMEDWMLTGQVPAGKEYFTKKGRPRNDKNDTSRRAAKYANLIIASGLIKRGDHVWGVEWETTPTVHFQCPDGEEVPLLGFIDVVEQLPNGQLMVTDYKTMKNWDWMIEPDELPFDPQCIVYCMWAKEHLVCLGEVVHFRHICVNKTNLQVRESRTMMTFDQIDLAWEELITPVVAKTRYYGRKKITKVLPNRGTACTKYGGCAQYMICQNIAYSGKEQLDVSVSRQQKPIRSWSNGEIKKRKEEKKQKQKARA